MARRTFLRQLATAMPLWALGPALARAADNTSGSNDMAASDRAKRGFTRDEFMEYITLFNDNDPSFIKFYHDDVVLELGNSQIRTPQGIRDFYREVKAHIHERVEVTHFISDPTGIAAELPSEFKVYKDWENGFFRRPLKAGEVLRIVSFVLYWVEDGKFRHIKSARAKLVNDWQMEA